MELVPTEYTTKRLKQEVKTLSGRVRLLRPIDTFCGSPLLRYDVPDFTMPVLLYVCHFM